MHLLGELDNFKILTSECIYLSISSARSVSIEPMSIGAGRAPTGSCIAYIAVGQSISCCNCVLIVGHLTDRNSSADDVVVKLVALC